MRDWALCCSAAQVRHAQDAGAVGVIVYDDEMESLIIMSKPRSHPDPDIPSVFVSQKAGMLMRKLIELEGPDGVRVRITPVRRTAWLPLAAHTCMPQLQNAFTALLHADD